MMTYTSGQLKKCLLGTFFVFFWTQLFGQENPQESIGFHIIDDDFNSIFFSDSLIELPDSICLRGEYLQYAYEAHEQGKIYAELIDLPRTKSRGAYLIDRSSGILGLSQSGTYRRGYGLLNSADPSCLSPWGSSWTKLDSLGNEEWNSTDKVDDDGLYVKSTTYKRDAQGPVKGKRKHLIFYKSEPKRCGQLGGNVGLEVMSRWVTDKKTEDYYNKKFDDDGSTLEYDFTLTTLTDSYSKSFSREDSKDDFNQIGPTYVENLSSGQIDAVWYLSDASKTNEDDKRIVVGGHPSFPDAALVTHDLNNAKADSRFVNNDFKLSSKVEQDWNEGDKVVYDYYTKYYFANDWDLRVHVDYDWPRGSVSCVLSTRGMEVARKTTERDGETLNIYTNSNSIDVNQVGDVLYVAVNSNVIFKEEIRVIPTGKMAFWGWEGERFLGANMKRPSQDFKGHVTNSTIQYFDVESKPVLKTQISDSQSKTIVGSGSGVVIDASNGYVVTNYHVVEESRGLLVEVGGTRWDATVVRTDENNDLALIQVEEAARKSISELPISLAATLGTKVYSAGYPKLSTMGKDIKITEGLVSSVSFLDDPSKFQVSCPITNGNSGGALLDGSGNLIGITQGGYRPDENTENVNAAVKSIYVLALAQTQGDCTFSTILKQSSIDFELLQSSVLPVLIQK